MVENCKYPVVPDDSIVDVPFPLLTLTPHIRRTDSGEESVIGYEGSFPCLKNGEESPTEDVKIPEVREMVRQPVDEQPVSGGDYYEAVKFDGTGGEISVGYSMRIPIESRGHEGKPISDSPPLFLYTESVSAD